MKTAFPKRTTRQSIVRLPWLAFASCIVLLLSQATVSLAQLRKIQGRYITLQTDLPSSDAIMQLPAAFDAAVPRWCAYFGVDISKLENWHVTGYLMANRDAFRQRGFLPYDLPDFAHGYQRGNEIWVIRQKSEYYTRHLMLHEGVHALMVHLYGNAGPAWYMEGVAEFLATHQWDGSTMVSPVLPASRDAFPYWGRLKVLREGRDQSKVLSFDAILNYSQKAHRQVEPYAWSWAALVMLNMYPEYRQVAIAHAAHGNEPPAVFTSGFRRSLNANWSDLQIRWQMLLEEVDYGFDVARNRIDMIASKRWDGMKRRFDVSAARGWHSTGIILSEGQEIHMAADGRYVIGNDPKPWICEPEGVTIDYYRGRPLGMMLAAIAPLQATVERYSVRPQITGIGRDAILHAKNDGLLLLRIGDLPSDLENNQGSASVFVEPAHRQ